MDIEIIFKVVLLAIVALVFVAISAVLNRVLGKLLSHRNGFGYWSSNLLTVPVISAIFGLYQYFSFTSPSCVPSTYHCFYMMDPLVRAGDALLFILVIPLASLCFSIPTTMWFVAKDSAKE